MYLPKVPLRCLPTDIRKQCNVAIPARFSICVNYIEEQIYVSQVSQTILEPCATASRRPRVPVAKNVLGLGQPKVVNCAAKAQVHIQIPIPVPSMSSLYENRASRSHDILIFQSYVQKMKMSKRAQ